MTSPSAPGLPITLLTNLGRSAHATSHPEGSGAWDLTSDARSAFHFFSVVPDPLPNQARTHDDVPIRWLAGLAIDANPHAVLLSLSRDCGLSGHRHPPTLTSGSSPNVYSQLAPAPIRLVAALGSYLGPLPPSHCPYSFIEDTARCKCRGASAWLVRSSPSSHAPPSKCTLA